MTISAESEESDVEQRPRRIQHRGAVSRVQGLLVARGGIFGGSIDRDGMDVSRWDGHPVEHRFAGHSVIALGMIVRNISLIAPVPGDPGPGKTSNELIGAEQLEERLRCRAARKRHAKGSRRCKS